jgi:hypothetical protein
MTGESVRSPTRLEPRHQRKAFWRFRPKTTTERHTLPADKGFLRGAVMFRSLFVVSAIAGAVGVAGLAPIAHDQSLLNPVSKPPPCDYINVDGQCIEAPDANGGNFTCCDGTHSHATHRNGACSHHGGICGGSGLQEADLRKVNGRAQDAEYGAVRAIGCHLYGTLRSQGPGVPGYIGEGR